MTTTSEIQVEPADDVDAPVGDADGVTEQDPDENIEAAVPTPQRNSRQRQVIAFGLLPTLLIVLAFGAGYLKWLDSSARDAQLAGTGAARAATDSTVAMLSYKPDTVENDLGAARDRLTGDFKGSYTSLINDVVIPGAKQKLISAQAKVVGAAPVSANARHAVVLVFVNQTVTIAGDPPTETASSVRVTLDKIGGHWLISQFDPV
jgi:Mce-associated membrane protein